MTHLTKLFAVLLFTATISATSANAQSVLNPNDPVVTYDSTKPPTEAPWGQIGKWVRTVRMWWNTDDYKAYIYKGVAFRLHFPKTYNPTASDGKKYPMLVMYHGWGEASPITDNEFHLLWGAQYFSESVKNGTFDGYVLFLQSQGAWGSGHYDIVKELVDYMVQNNKLDQFQIAVNGLSSGGQASWETFFRHPSLVHTVMPMSSVSIWYREKETVDKVKYTPFWNVHGGLDGSPAPYTAYTVRDSMLAAGANYRNTMYPNQAHDTWLQMWEEPDFWPMVSRTYASNPWALYGKTTFNSGETINAKIGIAKGFDGYEWRRNGVLISGADSNSIVATQIGTYDARVKRGTTWSNWSKIPVKLRMASTNTAPFSVKIEAENYSAMSGIQTEPTMDVGGGLNVGWQDPGDWLDYVVNIPSPGTYTLRFRIASQYNVSQFYIKNANGVLLGGVNVPNTGYFQTWQTIATQLYLDEGTQTLRIHTAKTPGGWNFNWWEITNDTLAAPTNQAPTANPGTAQAINLPTSSVTLTGSGTDPDGSITAYAWTQVSGPNTANIVSPSAATTNVTGLVQGSYVFRLTVTDNGGATGSADVIIVVNPPASTPSNRIEAESYTAMSGIQTEPTSDVGGGLNVGWQDTGDWLDYSVNVTTAGVQTVNFRVASMFTGPQFQVRNASGTVLATVTVPNTGSFQAWQTVSAQINLPAGQQTLRIHTSNAAGGWNFNWWEITGNTGGTPANQLPTANAGADQSITLPTSSVTLNGSGTDPDGTIASYTWSQISGPNTATIATPSAASTTVSGLIQGTYVFRLTVKDNQNATATDDVSITVNAATGGGGGGGSTRIQAEHYTAMSGIQTETTSDVGGGLNVGWQDTGDWLDYAINMSAAGTYTLNFRVASMFTGPQFQVRNSAGTVLATVNVPNTGSFQTWQTISAQVTLPAGQQTIRIHTSNAAGGWNFNWWEIVSNGGTPPANQAPTANAGPDKTVTLPTSTVSLTGSGSDADGTISSYAWTQVSGPNTATIATPSAATTNVSGLVQGNYVFRLTVTDNSGSTGTDDVTVTVQAAGSSTKIEAENYTSMSGIQTEPTSDVGGGLNVGWQDTGDWMNYSVNVSTAGTYTVNFRVATMFNGPQFQLRNSSGTVLATLNVPNTGGFQTWRTISAQVTLPAGQQTLRIHTSNAAGGWNINWWEIVKPQSAGGVNEAITTAATTSVALETSLDRVAAAPMAVYPNPVGDQLNLTINNDFSGRMRVDIINGSGMLVKTVALVKPEKGIHRISVPVNNLQRGNYVVRISMNQWIDSKKILKQ